MFAVIDLDLHVNEWINNLKAITNFTEFEINIGQQSLVRNVCFEVCGNCSFSLQECKS